MDIPPPHSIPLPESAFEGRLADTYQEAQPHWPSRACPPSGAPNIVVILMDDLGFGQLSCYGGPIEAPHIACLAENGLRFNNFHTTGLCSPTRAALLTGRNHHSVGFAGISEIATGFPGSNTFLPRSAATFAEILRQSGYSTMVCGKWHLTPTSESTAAGPFDRWPLGQGFERFFGFLPGEVDQWHPMLTVDNHRVPTPRHEGYHLSEDIADHAVRMIRDQQQIASGRPFLLYLPFAAPHCPFHAPQSFIEKYRGRFDHGWDVERQETFERQQAMGILPAGTELPPRETTVRPWARLSRDEQRLFARMQEAFAGFVDHADAQIGRIVDALRELEIVDDTLILFMSDNGASQEGQANGTINTERFRNLMPMSVAEMLPHLDEIGSPGTDPHYPTGWAMAGNTPFRRFKRDTHRGGNTDPLIAHWPARIKSGGGIRDAFLHVIDIYPTLLELAGIPVPSRVNGVDQKPIEGFSFKDVLLQGAQQTRRRIQYFEMLGSRAIWREGWTAVTWHKAGTQWSNDRWELYHQDEDFAQAKDLSKEEPARLAELIELWWSEARRHQVLPLDDRFRERFTDSTRPSASRPREVYRYFPGTTPVPNPAMPVTLNSKHSYAVRLRMKAEDDEGFLVGQGGELTGWALLVQQGRAVYVNNCLRFRRTIIRSSAPLPLHREIELRYEYIPGAVGRGEVNLFVDGDLVAREEEVHTAPMGCSMVQEGLQIGRCWGTSVASELYRGEYPFSGDLRHVELRTDPGSQLRPGSFADPGEPQSIDR